jgi:hypothetical protein
MKSFHCDSCGSLVFFENVRCLQCGKALGFLPETGELSTLEPASNGTFKALSPGASGTAYRMCANGQKHQICNWMIRAEDPNAFCVSCRLTETIPDLSVEGNLQRWHKLESAKRRVIYSILKFGLPMTGEAAKNQTSLRFNFLGNTPGKPPVMSGHEDGLITVNISEADDAVREQRRVGLHEPYRTLVGHFRHEIGHYYWDRLIANTQLLDGFRKLFGDENLDYGEALKAYYQHGPPSDWQSHFVSAYASAHPWEDWAESWAHCFHLIDTVETAASFGINLKPKHPGAKALVMDLSGMDEGNFTFDDLVKKWVPLTCALNSLNRGMGLQDLYPFAIADAALVKLRFVHDVLRQTGNSN